MAGDFHDEVFYHSSLPHIRVEGVLKVMEGAPLHKPPVGNLRIKDLLGVNFSPYGPWPDPSRPQLRYK